MSKRHPIDELFSQRLANSSASVPDDMWSRIAKTRKQKNRKKIIAWTTLSSLMLGLCIFAGWSLIDEDPLLGFFPLKTETIASRSGIASDLNPTASIPSGLSATSSNTSTQSTINQTVNAHQTLASTATSPSLNTHYSTITSNTSNHRNNIPALVQTTVETPTSSTPITIETTGKNVVNEEEGSPVANEENEKSRVAGPHQRVRMGKVDQLPGKLFNLSDQADIKLFANHAPRCADFASPFFHLDAELIAGPAYARQMLVAKASESTSHLQQRYDSEKAGISTSSSLRFAATSNTGLGLRSGFSYTQINEQFTHQVGSKIDVSIIFGPNGEVVGRDTVYTEAYEEKSTNRLKFIEIPLLLGYERKVGKLRIGINAGAYLNLFFDAKGTVFSPATGEPIAFGQEGDLNRLPIFERRATAAWYGGLSLAYNLHSRYSLLAEPFFKSYPRALSTTGYDLSQNYWMTGLQVGLRMRL